MKALRCTIPFFLLLVQFLPVDAQELGLAANYPRDAGIENDPAVVFTENFEEATIQDLLANWEDYKYSDLMSFSADLHTLTGGVQSLFMNGFADMYRRLLPGHEQLYLRFYAKFEDECQNVHHWVWLGGHNPSTAWPWPRAGTRPAGDERWSTGLEPMGAGWAWDFYTYWMHMRGNPGGPDYWGNTFSGRPSPWPAVKDEWLCIEFMVKMNTPVSSFNGEQAFWISGEQKAHLGEGFPRGDWIWDGFYPDPNGSPFEGFQWRTVPELNINYVWLEHYVDSDPACGVWFDDLVIATEYIGPMVDAGYSILRAGLKSDLPQSPDMIFSAPVLPFVDPDPIFDPGLFPPLLFYQVEPDVHRISLVKDSAFLSIDVMP
ncbi:hypothetical protein ACFLU6_06185 [Acidobacteriota bacterium]